MNRLVEVSYLMILCFECCRCNWKITHNTSEQFECQEPQRRSYRITELLNLNCNDDTLPAHVVLNRCDDMTGTCTNQKSICIPMEKHNITFYYKWKRIGWNTFQDSNATVEDHIRCGCNNTNVYQCT